MNTLLTGFKAFDPEDRDSEERDYEDPHRYLYCHKNLGGKKGVLPRCPLLKDTFNDVDFLTDILYPDGWDKMPQPKSQVEFINRQIMVLDWWVKEQVDPERPAFWFYSYHFRPCWLRVCAVELSGDGNLITQLTYNHPSTAAELKALWDNLGKKVHEWDALAQVFQSQCWIDRSRLVDPIEVKKAAAALRNELKIISELIEKEQKAGTGCDDILEMRPNVYGVGVNLRALWRRCWRWWKGTK